MPVIACPDCGHEVSTLAPSCPHCGRPSPAGMAPPGGPTAPQPAQEERLWRGSPSARVLIGRMMIIVAVLIVAPIVMYFVAANAPDPARVYTIGWAITALVVLVLLIALAIQYIRLRSTIYTISTQRVMIERGILAKGVEEIDLRYVEDTRFAQTFLERILGIGNVTLVSSDKTTPTIALFHVPDPRATRELIRTHAYQVSQRQVFTRAT